MSENYEQPWYLQAKQQEAERTILKLASERPNAPVAYSETIGYIEVPAVVVSYLSEPGAMGMTGRASFVLDSNYEKGLRVRALQALYESSLISKPLSVEAAKLRLMWAGSASEAADKIRSQK